MTVTGTSNQEISNITATNYRPDIDGLRSIAVLSVVAYHAGWSLFGGGYAGVDIFFVISGYLITSLVLKEQQERQFSLRAFYIRRARRLFPALFAMLAASATLSWWLLMPNEMEDFGESLATAAAFTSNIMFWSESGYFEGPSEFKPLLHTWSLAVEEQYYLFFPLLLLWCQIRGRYLFPIGLIFIISLSLSQWYVGQAPAAAFFLLPHRLWELMVGSLLAIGFLNRPSWFSSLSANASDALSLAGITTIAITVLGYNSATEFPGISALLPTLGTAAIIIAGLNADSRLRKLLSLRPFVAVGLISYSLYLWHWPALVFAKLYLVEPPTLLQTLIIVSSAFVLAWLSWRFVERPFRTQSGGTLSNSAVLPASSLCILVLVAAGVALDQTNGAPARLPKAITDIASIADDKPDERKYCSGVPAADVSLDRLCQIGSGQGAPDFIVWGDSHAMTMIPEFHRVANTHGRTGINATSNGCAALLGAWRPASDPNQECVRFNQAVLQLIQNTPTIETVILAGRWGIYAEGMRYKYESGENLALVDQSSPTQFEHGNVQTNARVWKRSITRTLTTLSKTPVEIKLVASVPEVGWNTPNIIARAKLLKKVVDIAPTREEFDTRQRNVTPVFDALTQKKALRLQILHPADILCPGHKCQIADGDEPYYIDEDHLSSKGVSRIESLVSKALAR